MSTVFISHANQDDPITGDLLDWLHQNGFRDTFVDHIDILGGENWTDRLRDQAASCRVVICVITADWLRSSECFNEFQAAWYMGKSILPLFLIDPADPDPGSGESARRLSRVLAETQGIDLRKTLLPNGRIDVGRDRETADLLGRSLRAVGAHSDIGLDPTAFAIDPAARPTPFPGLVSFGDTDADAAIFYGRSREIAEAIEELRSMRANADRRPLVILGVSGAGKSSVLKAGILPRLRREGQSWLPLRVFRPGIDPLGSFAEALSRTLGAHGVTEPPGQLRAALESALAASPEDETDPEEDADQAPIYDLLDNLAARLRAAATAPGATILISVDQAEELLRADNRAAMQLSAVLAAALRGRRGWLITFTIRTDRFPDLQGHPSFRNLKARGYDLRQLPPFRFSDVIEGPAGRYGVELAPDLVDAFMEDAPERDALPLLAFALQRLWDQFGGSRALRLADYKALGGMSGLISDAAERALAGLKPTDGQAAMPPPAQVQDRARLAERCFVPALVDVNENRAAAKRTANWSEFDAGEQGLLRQFEAWRLVVRRGVGDEATVEVAHDALFREWGRMRDWLAPEIHRIEVLRGAVDAARQWDRGGRNPVLLNHRGQRLADAKALLENPRYGDRMGPEARAYLAGCAGLRRRGVLSYAAVVVLAVVAVALGVWSYLQSERRMIAEREATFATRVADATGVRDISTLESFTNYILTDAYARTRADRFDVLRSVLGESLAAIHPEYAIAEYALDAVDIPDNGSFELEYSAERIVDPDLFPVLWRPQAIRLAERLGLPAPGQFRLIENADFPPGRVVIRRSGEVVFDSVLPATDTRHMLDVGALDRADLKQFFDANRDSFTPATHITSWSDYFYVPDWSVPIWNAGRDRNADSRVIPPGADFTLLIANLLARQPEIVIDDLAVDHFFDRFPEPYEVTIAEYRAIRGAKATGDVLEWLRAGQALGDMLFSLPAIAALGPDGTGVTQAADGDEAGLYIHGPILPAIFLNTRSDNIDGSKKADSQRVKGRGNKKPGVAKPDPALLFSEEVVDARREALNDSFRHVTLRTAPVRILVPQPDPDTRIALWPPFVRALYRDETLALSEPFLDARAEALTRMFRETGLLAIEIAVVPDPGLGPEEVAIAFLDEDSSPPIPVVATDPIAAFERIFATIRTRVAATPDRFLFPHRIPGYLEGASQARSAWAQETFSHTDLTHLVAGLLRHETANPELVAARGGSSLLINFDWLLGALVFSVAAEDARNGPAHLDLWRDLAGRIGPQPAPASLNLAVAEKVTEGVNLLAADDVAGASRAFAAAVEQDPAAARAAFLEQYFDTAPKMLFARISAECTEPTRPGIGVIEAQQLEFLLGAFGPRVGTAISREERQHFELCLLGSKDPGNADDWIDSALSFAADLRAPEELPPDQALWLGRTLWQLYDPMSDNAGPVTVGRRFLLSALRRIESPYDRIVIAGQLSDDCFFRIDIQPCTRRQIGLAEEIGDPALGLYPAATLAESVYPEDHRRAGAMLDLFQAAYGLEPDFFGEEYAEWFGAYLHYVQGLLLFTSGKPGSEEWREARDHLTIASEHSALRFTVLPSLSKVVAGLDGFAAAEALTAEAVRDAEFNVVDPTELANLHSLRFSYAIQSGHAEDFLDDLVSLPDRTECLNTFDGDCVAAWLWRATAQVVYRHADWQTTARIVTSRVNHPYSTLVALILNAQGGEAAGSSALLLRNWRRVNPNDWERRIELEDERVWREILLGYSVGEIVEGYRPEDLLEVLQDPEAFAAHGLSRIGLFREEMLTEALFYYAMLEIAEGRVDEGIDLLRRTRDLGYWLALEHAFASPILAQLEAQAGQ